MVKIHSYNLYTCAIVLTLYFNSGPYMAWALESLKSSYLASYIAYAGIVSCATVCMCSEYTCAALCAEI